MAKNSKSDVAQLQAAFGYIKKDGKPYWGGAIDGVMTDDLGMAIRLFQRDEAGLEETGIIRAASGDKTRARIRNLCKGTPFANMRGLIGTTIVFSLVDVPSIYGQTPIKGIGLWREAMDWAYKNSKLAAGLYSLPLHVDPDSLKILITEGRAHLTFQVSADKVKWLDNAIRTFSSTMPDEAINIVKHDMSNELIISWSGDGLSFMTKDHFYFFKAVPEKGEKTLMFLKKDPEFYLSYHFNHEARRGYEFDLQVIIDSLRTTIKRFNNAFQKIDERAKRATAKYVGEKAVKIATGKSNVIETSTDLFSDLMKNKGSDWKNITYGIVKKTMRLLDFLSALEVLIADIQYFAFLHATVHTMVVKINPEIKKMEELLAKLKDLNAEIEKLNKKFNFDQFLDISKI